MNRERLPLEQRAAWLYQKAGADLMTGQIAELFVETAEARAAHSTAPDAVIKALGDTIVADAVLFEGGAFEHFLSRRFAPPQLRNTEGESLTLGEATLRVADPVAVAAALDEVYERRDDLLDGQVGWHEHVTTDGMERIRASIELSGDELHIAANSDTPAWNGCFAPCGRSTPPR